MKSLFRSYLILFCLVMVGAAAAENPAPKKPNVLFIAVDDLNDWIGCLGGHPLTKTPNLDRFAKSGILFTNAHCAAPVCNPSRVAVFTGVPPWKSGVYNNRQPMRRAMPDTVLIPRHFSQHGYWSAGSGKMLHYMIDPQSWDDYYPEKEKDDPFPPTYNPPNRPINLPVGGPWQYDQTDWASLDVTDEEYGGDFKVAEWVSKQLATPKQQPFFLSCGIYHPHEPWFVPSKYFEPFPIESIVPGPGYKEDDNDDLPPAGRKIAETPYFPHILKHKQWKNAIQAYLASIYYADTMIGHVLDALEKSPAKDNTIVVLWSDHGWHLGEKQHWQKFTGWRAVTRVPLIIKVPKGTPGLIDGTTAGEICDRAVSLQDLFHTLNELCALPPSANPNSGRISLVPLLKNPKAEWPHAAICQLENPGDYSVSHESWRYIHYKEGEEELYDIAKDPHEWHNLLHQNPTPEHRAKADELKAFGPVNPAPPGPPALPKKTKP